MTENSAEIAEVFGRCPDCDDKRCIMNCGSAMIDIRQVTAAAVIVMERHPAIEAHAAVMDLLALCGDEARSTALLKYRARQGKSPRAGGAGSRPKQPDQQVE